MSDYKFYTSIKVRYGDLDPQGHVNNARFLTFFEHARVYYLRELGLFHEEQSFMDIGIIIANINITYHAPIAWKDKIKIGTRTTRIGNKSIITDQCVVSKDTTITYASGTVVLVMYDYHSNKTIPVPQTWRETICKYEGIPLSSSNGKNR